MASYKPIMQFEAELRPCKANGKNALFHCWGEHKDALLTIAIVEYVDDGRVEPVLPSEIRFLDTKGKAMGYCWDDSTVADCKTALVIGKTQHDAENMVKNLGLVGFKTILTRGEENLNNLDGFKADRVYIYDDCTNRAKCFAQAFVQNVIYGAVWVIKRDKESEGMIESTRA